MHDLVKQCLPEVEALCRKHHVRRLDLFGSAADARFDPTQSDVDFLVEFGTSENREWGGDFQDLKRALTGLFRRHVDLVDAPAIRNPIFKQMVLATRVPIYAEPGT